MNRILHRIAAASMSLLMTTTTGAAQTAAEGRLDLRDLLARLPGRYDNEPQRYFLEGMKRAEERPARTHVVIRRLEGESPVRLEILEHESDEHSVVRQRRTWTLAVSDDGHVELRGDETLSPCSVVWRRRAGVFVAEVPAACRGETEAAALLQPGARLWVSSEEIWRELPGAARPLQLLRATEFDCFVAIQRRNGEPQALTKLRLHDRGGTLTLRTDEQPARELTLLLRHGLWPSVSGNNFVPLMNLYLYEEPGRRMLGNGWATPESGRVGFGVGDEDSGGQSASARCTRLRT
jgi:hypothetical protein